jgi:hypothetical protein
MKSFIFIQPRPDASARLDAHFTGIKEANSDLPEVSDKDKKGGKLSQAMAGLTGKIIQNYALVINFLVRNFTIDNLVVNKAVYDENERQIDVYQREIKRLKDQNTCIGIQMAIDYRQIYEAFQKAAEEDASLKALRDEFGKPFERKMLTTEQKKAIAAKKIEAAKNKAEALESKAAKNAKNA